MQYNALAELSMCLAEPHYGGGLGVDVRKLEQTTCRFPFKQTEQGIPRYPAGVRYYPRARQCWNSSHPFFVCYKDFPGDMEDQPQVSDTFNGHIHRLVADH